MQVGDEFTSCIVTSIDNLVEVMEFGVDYNVSIELLYPDIYNDKISKNMEVKLFEGNKLIGIGKFVG